MTVVTVGSGLKVALIWGIMFILTLVQSRTHVDTVQTVLDDITISRHICWSHTMKVLGLHVTFVRRNSAAVSPSRYIYFATKMWSRMFAVNVQWVSVQKVNCDDISLSTQTSNCFAVVRVAKILSINVGWKGTSRDVLSNWDLNQFSSYSWCLIYSDKRQTENKYICTVSYQQRCHWQNC